MLREEAVTTPMPILTPRRPAFLRGAGGNSAPGNTLVVGGREGMWHDDCLERIAANNVSIADPGAPRLWPGALRILTRCQEEKNDGPEW